jgi:citrate synthase
VGHLLEVYDTIKETMLQENDRAPSMDFPAALLYKVLGLPSKINASVFQASRHFNWVVNLRRQREGWGPFIGPHRSTRFPDWMKWESTLL